MSPTTPRRAPNLDEKGRTLGIRQGGAAADNADADAAGKVAQARRKTAGEERKP